MLDTRSKKILGSTILTAVVVVTLVVAPYTLLDPMNLPKMCMLTFFAIFALSLVAPGVRGLFSSDFKALVILVSLFILQIVFVLFFSGANFGGQFYGTFGRNTGALSYFSLAFLLLSTSLVSDKKFLKRFIHMALIIGVILVIYGNFQYLGLEPFPYTNLYTVNAPIGTFGNPDFQSAFMGLISVIAFTMVFNTAFNRALRVGLAIMGGAALVVVYETIAKQGYLNLMAGVGVAVMLWLFMTKRKTLGIAVAGIGTVGGGLVFLGLINAGPLASFLYKGSLAARGYYWRAAIKMLIDHPFVGVGMDGFVDWYRRARASDYATNSFFSISNAAHNVYLDIASSGGFPLIALYCAILALVIISIVKVVRRNNGFDVYFVALVGAWVAYQTQAFISINQLGIAIWGWVLSGLIIGYEINTRTIDSTDIAPPKHKQQQRKVKVPNQPLSSSALIMAFAGIVVAALVAIPPYFTNASFFSALKSGDIKTMQAAARLKPIDERRLLHVGTVLRDNKLDAEAIAVVRDAVIGYPDSTDLWLLWASIPTAAPSDVTNAKAQIKRLDPFNPELK